MTIFGMNGRFSYNIYLFGENDINVLMPTTLFRFTSRVFYRNTPLPERFSGHIKSQTFFQKGSHFLTTLLSPLLRYFCTQIIEAMANVGADEIRKIFQIDDVAPHSQFQIVTLWIVINVTDNIMHAATQGPLRMVLMSEEAFNTLKKSTVLQTECCCICLDEFNLNAERYILPCQHFFHKKCIMRWIHTNQTCPIHTNQTCPMCRQSFRTLKD
ncbi:hypothetical protein V8G54_003813 [Vigna mungo]|uniref:RING-type domain-containing protein n=1 Tax=Vigna mungo TaxID=3915 RepID=A0AAQ3SAH2_VIGMU